MANAMAVGRTQDPQLDKLVVSVQSNLSECPHPITLMSSHQDPCSDKHTTANDVRDKRTWPGMDETGLMVMACRHDHIIKFVNLVQSGEKCVD